MSKKRTLSKREQYVEDWFELPMLLVTLLLIFTLLVPIIFDLPDSWRIFFAAFNLFIWFTFYIELFVKLYVAQSKREGIKRNWALCIIAVAPLFTPLRFMRISRLLSLVRFLRLQEYVKKFKASFRDLIYNMEQILITLGVFVLVSGFIMWQVEQRFDGSIQTLPDALWWAVITISTIGYGDIIPTSPEGRVVGAVIGLLGAIFFMVFVAKITSMFVKRGR